MLQPGVYKLKELSRPEREDVYRSVGDNPGKLLLRVEIIPWAIAKKVFEAQFGGEEKVSETMKNPRVQRLASQIAKDGLREYPVGTEGYHRSMALLSLGWDIPYIRILDADEGSCDLLGAAALFSEWRLQEIHQI